MIDYLKVYRNFLLAKNVNKDDPVEDGDQVEKHHIIPKFMGGKNTESNIIYLHTFDHLIAHFILAAACKQNGMALEKIPAVSFTCRNNIDWKSREIISYWNPVSKLKVRVTAKGKSFGQGKIMSLREVCMFMTDLRCNESTISEMNTCFNLLIPRLFDRSSHKNGYFGYIFDLI